MSAAIGGSRYQTLPPNPDATNVLSGWGGKTTLSGTDVLLPPLPTTLPDGTRLAPLVPEPAATVIQRAAEALKR